jgi:transcriptional regulator with XRE-family HTH domain
MKKLIEDFINYKQAIGMTNQQVAEDTGLSVSTIDRIMNGKVNVRKTSYERIKNWMQGKLTPEQTMELIKLKEEELKKVSHILIFITIVYLVIGLYMVLF